MKKSIWVIDDDMIYQMIMKKLIEKCEYFEDITIFSNGEEAFYALKSKLENDEKLPDVILLDIEMPLMDGWRFMSEINILESNIKNKNINIFISSSSIAIEDKIKAETNPNIVGYLTKPLTLEDLNKIAS
jgi:two-component system, chemotaxis family, chemotaxis protein CheY